MAPYGSDTVILALELACLLLSHNCVVGRPRAFKPEDSSGGESCMILELRKKEIRSLGP